MSTVYDVLIIGAGPAGLAAGLYAGRAKLNTIILEKEKAGGQIVTTHDVENYPGSVEETTGPNLIARMVDQAKHFGVDMVFDSVESVDFDAQPKVIKTKKGEYQAKTVIIATGASPRKLGAPGEKELTGKGVSYCATCDGFFFRDKPIAVVGGGDSAMEEATFLSRFGSKVSVIHRRDELRASKVMVDRAAQDPKIEFEWNSVVKDMKGENGLEKVILEDTKTGETREIDANGLFIAIGHEPRTELVKGQLELDEGYIKVNHPTTETSMSGVFACGDVVDSKYRQAITAAGTGAQAALDAQHYLESLPVPGEIN